MKIGSGGFVIFLIGIAAGLLIPIQTSLNSKLRERVGSPYFASLISFSVGALVLACMTLITQGSLLVSTEFINSHPWWIWLGGLLGVIYLTSNILLFPKLRGVQTVIMPILGQIIMSNIIDQFGLFNSKQSSISFIKIVGLLLVILGIFFIVVLDSIMRDRHSTIEGKVAKANQPILAMLPWFTLGIVAGMFNASQSAINGYLGKSLGSPIKGAFYSFFIGMLVCVIVVLFTRRKMPIVKKHKEKAPPYIFIGGAIGALGVFGNAYLVPILGTGLTIVMILIGQLLGGVLIDQVGFLGVQKKPISIIQVIGIAIMIIGVFIIKTQ